MVNKEDIKIRSEKTNEILSTPPHFLVRSGIGLITFMLLIFLSVSYIVKYPDFIRTRITITGGSPPVEVVAIKSGVIDSIFVKEGELVEKGQALASFECTLGSPDKIVLNATIGGAISFYKLWSEKQVVNEGDELILIIPEATHIFGYSYVPVTGSDKLKEGQRVQIKLDPYPYEEFGMLEGIVQSISSFAKEGRYIVRIDLPRALQTNYDREVDFIPEMKGEAQIITEDLRLIDRIFSKLKSRLR